MARTKSVAPEALAVLGAETLAQVLIAHAQELDHLRATKIATRLAAQDRERAIEPLWDFLGIADTVLERMGDGIGAVEEIFGAAMQTFAYLRFWVLDGEVHNGEIQAHATPRGTDGYGPRHVVHLPATTLVRNKWPWQRCDPNLAGPRWRRL
jgi:hypothetical protein